MMSEYRKAVAVVLLLFYVALVSVVPIVLLWVALKQPGIDLQVALEGPSTLETFMRLFNGTATTDVDFRAAFKRSLVYSTVVALITASMAVAYAQWASGWPKRRAISFSFMLLTLVLLPQTYFILPMLGLLQMTPIQLPKATTIVALECLIVLPLSGFALYLLSGDHIRRLQGNTALDSLSALTAGRRIVQEDLTSIAIVFWLGWASAWGNYLIPFSFGDRNSYSALVQIVSFSSNVGRDWAMISAAGFVVLLPSMFVAALSGVSIYRWWEAAIRT